MTFTSCFVDITVDKTLMKRVTANEFCEDESGTAPILFPPGPNGYWTGILPHWCDDHGIECRPFPTAIYGVRARVKKHQILRFVSDCYDDIPSYTDPEQMLTSKGTAYLVVKLVNLRAFLAQNLSRNRWYYLVATEDG
jgi:hypothetical protein